MAVHDVTKFLFAGSDKQYHDVPRMLAKYLESNDIGLFLFNGNYGNHRVKNTSARDVDIHHEAHDVLVNFIERMKLLESQYLNQGESKKLYNDVYSKWDSLSSEVKDFFQRNINLVQGPPPIIGSVYEIPINVGELNSDNLHLIKFRFKRYTCNLSGSISSFYCPVIFKNLPEDVTNIWKSDSNSLKNKNPKEYYSSLYTANKAGRSGMSGGATYGEYPEMIHANLSAYFGKAISRSSNVSSSSDTAYPDPSICPSNQAKYWKFDTQTAQWNFEMNGQVLSLNKHADYDQVYDPSTCYNLFVGDEKKCNDFVQLITNRSDKTMDEFLKGTLTGDEFGVFKNLPSSEDFKKMDPRGARKILKKFGFQKVRVTPDGYERVQTVEEWIESRLYKSFSTEKVINALKDSKNKHVLNFLNHCICRANTLYKHDSFRHVLLDKFANNNPLVKPHNAQCFDIGNDDISLQTYKHFLESGRFNQSGGAHDSTGGLLTHFMKLNNLKYPNLSTSACKYLESNSKDICSLWENAFKIIDRTSYNRGYLISDHIKSKVLDEIKHHKKLTAELTSVVCGLENLANAENSGTLYEANTKGFIQAGGQPDLKYDEFKRLAQRSYDNMLRVNHKLKDNDKRLRGLFLRIIEMMSKDELEDLED